VYRSDNLAIFMRQTFRTLKLQTPGTLRRVQGLLEIIDIVLKCNKKYIKTAADS